MKPNVMKCWNCDKEFEFTTKDIVEYIDCEVGESPINFVRCPNCNTKQEADYNY